MGRDAKVEVRIEKRKFSEGAGRAFRWGRWTGTKPKMISLYVVLVNGRRVDSFMKRRNAEAKARRLRSSNKDSEAISNLKSLRNRLFPGEYSC
jgi:hypothetical protein